MLYSCFVEMTGDEKNIIVSGFMEAQSEEEAFGYMARAARLKTEGKYRIGAYSCNLIPLEVIKRSIQSYGEE